jgi:hypothetical protein
MSIKFNCPHCQKAFQNVKDELAGQKRKCPGCNNILTIPAPVSAPADLEAFAAAALSEQAEVVAETAESGTVDFVCDFCDEKVQVAAELSGKQTSCPHCRRIVKVPLLEKKDPKDWRNVKTRIPSAARRDAGPMPEGAWDTGSVTAVSAQSLLDAQALASEREPATWQDWTKRGAVAAGGLVVVGLMSLVVIHFLTLNHEHRALDQALQFVNGKGKIDPEVKAGVLQAIGEYKVRANDIKEARNHFTLAQKAIGEIHSDSPNEHDAMLIDLALAQVDLGSKEAVSPKQESRIWDKTHGQIRHTLSDLKSPDGRMEGLREVTRKLLDNGQGAGASSLGSLFPDEGPQAVATIGLEMVHAKQEKEAERLATQGQQLFDEQRKQSGSKKPEAKPLPPPTALIALWLALDQEGKASALSSKDATAALPGYAEGLARKGKFDAARTKASEARLPEDRLKALIAVAAVALDDAPKQGAGAAKQILPLIRQELKETPASSWQLLRLVRLGLAAGLVDEVQELIPLMRDPSLRARAQLDLLRFLLAGLQKPADLKLLTTVNENAPEFALAHELIARHNARWSGPAFRKTVQTWEPEKLRPLGNAGVALGLQDQALKDKR